MRSNMPWRANRCAMLLVLCGWFICGCAPQKPPQPSEAEVKAKDLLNSTFAARNAEFWYAVQKIGSTVRLVEFHRPSPQLLRQAVSETDGMNGVTERYNLTLTAAQYRYWDGQRWTEWQQGANGGAALVNSLLGGLAGFWTVVLEKKNGAWQVRPMQGSLTQDRAALQQMIAAASAGK